MRVTNAGKLSGELLARYDGANTRYYHFDALGSTVLVTNGGGGVTGSYAYGAWDSVAGTTGATVYPYLYVGQLGYYTHTSDQGAEAQRWLNLGVRFYDPEIGRFERRDSIDLETVTSYAYARLMPVAAVDPGGLAAQALFGGQCGKQITTMIYECGKKMQAAAEAEVRALGVPGMHNGPGDALKHCVGMCKMVAHCPTGTAELGGFLHEWTSGWGTVGPVKDEGKMDLHNNAVGRSCGKSVATRLTEIGPNPPTTRIGVPRSRWNGSCLECCKSKLRSGKLVTLPRTRWD